MILEQENITKVISQRHHTLRNSETVSNFEHIEREKTDRTEKTEMNDIVLFCVRISDREICTGESGKSTSVRGSVRTATVSCHHIDDASSTIPDESTRPRDDKTYRQIHSIYITYSIEYRTSSGWFVCAFGGSSFMVQCVNQNHVSGRRAFVRLACAFST